MRKLLFGLLSTFSCLSYANVCDVPKKSINIHGLYLGKPIAQVKSEHPNTFKFDLAGESASIGFIDQSDFKDNFHGTPVTGAGFISFNEKKLVTGFSVNFDGLREFDALRYKNGVTALYGLPTKNWKQSKKSDEYQEFSYDCNEYSIEIFYSTVRNNFMIVKSK